MQINVNAKPRGDEASGFELTSALPPQEKRPCKPQRGKVEILPSTANVQQMKSCIMDMHCLVHEDEAIEDRSSIV